MRVWLIRFYPYQDVKIEPC